MAGKGETFTNSSGGKSAVIVREADGKIKTTVTNEKGTTHQEMDTVEARKMHENLGSILHKNKNKL